ncbi:MAG TPA: HAMP domain-containing protein [Thermodesulfobacteriota bacterium]|nr:HAMP domain-containing protein [Thermodesulfobacteriota bacterium]
MKTTSKPEKSAAPSDVPQRKGFGLRGKMFVLFFLIPISLILAASLLYMNQLNTLSSHLAQKSTDTVTKVTEEVVAQRGREVASQCKVYLITHPELKRAFFNYDLKFKRIAVQRIGVSGYTAIYETPGSDGIWRLWTDVNPNVVGIDTSTLKDSLGESFPGFWKIYTGVKGGKESQGYYKWRDADGVLRDKFMVCVPVEGTTYVLAATAYLEEFTGAAKFMQESAAQFALKTRNIVIGILAGTLILIGFTVALYGYKLTKRIKSLTYVADRISVGDLDAKITEFGSGDEIGDLALAIKRMQESIRLAIKRMKEKE